MPAPSAPSCSAALYIVAARGDSQPLKCCATQLPAAVPRPLLGSIAGKGEEARPRGAPRCSATASAVLTMAAPASTLVQKYRICLRHSTADELCIGGEASRWCQQASTNSLWAWQDELCMQ